MSLFSTKVCALLTRQDLLKEFRNIIKLKHPTFQVYNRMSSLYFLTKCLNPYSIQPILFTNHYNSSNICYCEVRQMSRWIKCSSSGIHMSQNSRKKIRKKSEVIAERVKLKLQSARRETKQKVEKKIVKIKENILTIPNILCVLRIASTPILAYSILSEFYTTSLGIVIFAGFTDWMDGYIARNFPNQQTMIGSFLDPAADKLLVATLFLTLTANGLIPVLLTSLIISRDAFLMGAGFYIRYVSLPPPKTLSRYFDMSFPTARLSPTFLSKANTLIQLSLVTVSLAAPVFSYVDHFYLHILWYATGASTILSAGSYLYYNSSTYKLHTRDEKEK